MQDFSNEIFTGLWSQKESFMFADIIFDAITDESHQFSFHSLTARGILVSDDERSNNEAFIKWSIEKIKKINNEIRAIKSPKELEKEVRYMLIKKQEESRKIKHEQETI